MMEARIVSANDIVALIENCMDIEEASLVMSDILSNFEEWDSLTVLSIIAAVDEKYHKHITGEELKKVVTVSDLVELINK